MSSQSVMPGEDTVAHPSARWRSVSELLDARTAATSSAPAISFPAGQFTYGQVTEASLLAARRLKAAGVEPGDRVGILLREACEPYVTYGLAILRLGAICVPINARNKTHELSYVIEHADLRLLLIADEFEGLVAQASKPARCQVVVVGRDPAFDSGVETVSAQEVAELERQVRRDTPA